MTSSSLHPTKKVVGGDLALCDLGDFSQLLRPRRPLPHPPVTDSLAGATERLPEALGGHVLGGKPPIKGHGPEYKQIVVNSSNALFVDRSTNLFDSPEMPKRAPETMPNRILELRNAKGLSQQDLADAVGTSNQMIGYLERGERKLTQDWMQRLAKPLGVNPTELMRKNLAPLVGYVGAGSEAHYYDGGDPPNDWVPAPMGSTETTVAVQVRGDSLGPGFNRWLVFYDEVRNPPTEDMLRRLCVVGLRDGRVLVKWLHPGSEPNRYHLVSQTEGMIENVEITWAARVNGMAPY